MCREAAANPGPDEGGGFSREHDQKGQDTPILVRPDGQRFVLVEGLHRLEACKALGETTVPAYLVQARKH